VTNSPDDALLRMCLYNSVPFWYDELRPKAESYWMSRKGACAQAIAEKGDVLMYGSKRAGAAADVFNRLAEGVALLMLITKHPFEIFDLRFLPDGKIEDLRALRETNSGPLQSEAVPPVCEGALGTSGNVNDSRPDSAGENNDR
jgi:hypothetical protein